MHKPRRVRLREAALASLSEDQWMSLDDWETALVAAGYRPPSDAKRPDQTRRSLAGFAARHKHLIDSTGRGQYRRRAVEDLHGEPADF